MCRRNVKHWLWGDGENHNGWVWTIDEHDDIEPIKIFPYKTYIERLVDLWLNEPIIFIYKSRQMLLTWTFVALNLWLAQFHEARLVFFQSKKEKDADSIVERAHVIYENQPAFLKQNCNPGNAGKHTYCKLEFPDIHSKIVGIPEGGDQIRSHTASSILSDEAAFQPEIRDSYGASKPCIDGGGRFTALTTSSGRDDFYFLYYGYDEESARESIENELLDS